MKITLFQLRAFAAVSRRGSFTAAANELHRTQPAITATIQQLEEHLGKRLFDRSAQGVRLTSTALELAPAIWDILVRLDEVISRANGSELAQEEARLVIGALPSVASNDIARQTAAFRVDHPHVRIAIEEASSRELAAMVRAGEIEFAITSEVRESSDLDQRLLICEALCAYFHKDHALRAVRRPSVSALAHCELILLARGGTTRRMVERAFRASGRPVYPEIEAGTADTALALVARGAGVAILPRLSTAKLAGFPDVMAVPLLAKAFARTLVVIHRRDRPLSALARAFLAPFAMPSADLPEVTRTADPHG